MEEKLPFGKNLIYALQHVFIMVAGAVAVPMTVGGAAGDIDITFLISCALFAAGVATVIQTFGLGKFAGAKIAVVEGTSFAALAAMKDIAAGKGGAGLQEVAGAVIAAGLLCFLLSGLWGKLLKFFPHVVTGTVVTIIGISLFPVAINWIKGNTNASASVTSVAIAGISLLIVLLCNKFLSGILGNLSVLFGIFGGTIICLVHDVIYKSQISSGTVDALMNLDSIKSASWFGLVTPFKYGFPTFNLGSILPLLIIMLVIMTEATGNMIAVHEMSGKDMSEKNLARGLRASGLSTMVSGCFNSYPVTPFAQNVGMLSLTNVYSRFVTLTSGIILLVIAFFPKFAAIFAAIPKPVLGGVGFAMFGVVTVSGIRTLGKVNFFGNRNTVIVAVSIGLSVIPIVSSEFFAAFPPAAQSLLHSGITIGSVSAILLNILFNMILQPKKEK